MIAQSHKERSCGVDNSPITVVYEGTARVTVYPWMGILFYPMYKKRLTTAVVLVTRQMAIGTATEIDKLPKHDFRERSRVVFGHNCSGPTVSIRDYTFHPDYEKNTYSALVMIQLETDHLQIDCNKPIIRIHKMEYVNEAECKQYYRRSQLDVSSLWPSYATCARALDGGECVWRSGAALVMKLNGRWRLLGFGVHGPGCRAPARFLDYGMYHKWVKRNIARIGTPTITRLAPNHMVLRRTLSTLQRYGPCDKGETKTEIYTDTVQMEKKGQWFHVTYNLSLYADVEYSCVVFRADNYNPFAERGHDWYSKPKLRLRRWCAGSTAVCYDFQYIEIHFHIDIYFVNHMIFKLSAYGKEAKVIDPIKASVYANQ
ncbi:uncharacterized protein LOC115455914, partial [Manduca sexta]|uniref:uncharacterized protein LOC115455914 n=1 Tax=Manduca sexta TaxID=7130 RepID=UPI00188E72FC